MDQLTKLKILGTPRIYMMPNNNDRLGMRYESSFYGKPNSNLYLINLARMGFQINAYVGNKVRALLPMGWVHIRVDRNLEIIIDEKGRKRIHIERNKYSSYILRRFDFELTTVEVDKDGEMRKAAVGIITDSGEAIGSYPLDNGQYEYLLQEVDGDQEKLMELFKQSMSNILAEQFPDWQNEIAYWEE